MIITVEATNPFLSSSLTDKVISAWHGQTVPHLHVSFPAFPNLHSTSPEGKYLEYWAHLIDTLSPVLKNNITTHNIFISNYVSHIYALQNLPIPTELTSFHKYLVSPPAVSLMFDVNTLDGVIDVLHAGLPIPTLLHYKEALLLNQRISLTTSFPTTLLSGSLTDQVSKGAALVKFAACS